MAATAPTTTPALPDQPRRSLPHNLTASPLTSSQLQVLGDSVFADNALLAFICPPPAWRWRSLCSTEPNAAAVTSLRTRGPHPPFLLCKLFRHETTTAQRRKIWKKGRRTSWACGLPPMEQKDLLVFCAVSCFCGPGRTQGTGVGQEMNTPQLPLEPLTSTQPLGMAG